MEIKKCTVFGDVKEDLKFKDIIKEISDDGKALFYHSSPSCFKDINLDYCSGDNKDFGKGFYLSATAEFCDWYMQQGAKEANGGVLLDSDKYYLYQCLVDSIIEDSPSFLNLTSNLRELARICYTGRFICTDKNDVLSKYDAILGWMVDDLNFKQIKNKLLKLGLLVPDRDKNRRVVYKAIKQELTDKQLDAMSRMIFMNNEHGAYQLAIKEKLIAEDEKLVKLLAPEEILLGGK